MFAIAENFDTSSDDTELFKALLVLSSSLLLLFDADEDDEKAHVVGCCWYEEEFRGKEQLPSDDDVTSDLFLKHCSALRSIWLVIDFIIFTLFQLKSIDCSTVYVL